MNRTGRVFVVSAPSGGGKTSLTRAAVERLARLNHPTAISISYTTRAPRPGEQDGVHYHFVSPATFEAMIGRGEFLEHAQVFGQRYGTGRKATEALLARGCDVILDIDWQGGRQVRKQVQDAVSVFILPPSREELERRLRDRGQDSDAVIARRMAQARDEISHCGEYEHLIVNQDFEQALAELLALFTERLEAKPTPPARYKPLIQKLLA
ncbi:MAG: guanylate kinase [Hydrocarboniphaga effusa]|nr:guanylate kinase [Hydrocarboniphaga effusa]